MLPGFRPRPSRILLAAALALPAAALAVGGSALAGAPSPAAHRAISGPATAPVASRTKTGASGDFVHGVLPPPPPGSSATYNSAAEPQIRADAGGSYYITSENGVGAGTDAWKSTDAGM